MQSSDVDRSINYIYKNLDLGMRSILTLADLVNGMLSYLDQDRDANFLKRYVAKGGKCSFITCTKEAAVSIERALRQNGIRFVSSGNTTMEGNRIIVFADKDSRDVSKIVNRYRCEHNKGGLMPKEQLSELSGGSMRKVTNLGKYDASMAVEIAERHAINVSVENGRGDTFNVVFSSTDRKAMESIKMTLALQKAHKEAYSGYCTQYDYEEKIAQDISRKASNHTTNEPIYIADLEGNTMTVTADKVVYKEYGGAETVIDYADFGRNKTITGFIAGMNNGRELTKGQFQLYEEADLTGKKQIVIRADHENGRPGFSREQIAELKKMEENRLLYEQKLSMDNPEQEVYSYSYLNNEMRMAAFQEYEAINREAVHDKKELRETDAPAIYDDARSLYRGMRDEYEEVPTEAEKYAEYIIDNEIDRLEELEEEFNRADQFTEIIHDADANMLPDDRQG